MSVLYVYYQYPRILILMFLADLVVTAFLEIPAPVVIPLSYQAKTSPTGEATKTKRVN